MSRTLTSRPSCKTNDRGNTRERFQNDRGRLDQPERAVTRGRSLNRLPNRRTVAATSSRAQSLKNMNNQGQAYGQGMNENSDAGHLNEGGTTAAQQRDTARSGTYAGGYTMFPPNERKREQIRNMAQTESQAYQQYKQANAVTHVSHIGTLGGGELTEAQVRTRQANAVRAQKFNLQKKQREQIQARKRAEELEIDKKKAEARMKAEQNAARQAHNAPAAEVRRKREAFLRQFEKTSVGAGPSSSEPGHR